MIKTKKVYFLDAYTKEFLYQGVAYLCPETKSVYNMPANSTEIEPPEHKDGFARVFTDGKWEYVEDKRGTPIYDCATGQIVGHTNELFSTELKEGFTLEVPEEGDVWIDGEWKPKPPPTEEEISLLIDLQRQAAYQVEADPLFFKWQRGEGSKKEWTDKVKEIKERYK